MMAAHRHCVRLSVTALAKIRGLVCLRYQTSQVFRQYASSTVGGTDDFRTSNGSESTGDSDARNRNEILKCALDYVPQFSWSKRAVIAGAEAAGLPPLTHGVLNNGPADLVDYFNKQCNDSLTKMLEEQYTSQGKNGKLKTSDFIQSAVEFRLKLLIPYIDTWADALAIQALPQNAWTSWVNLSNLVDEIWHYAGDRSTDFSWYTKRLSLAAVYQSTEVVMITDKSEDFKDTWNFLDSQLRSLAKAGRTRQDIERINDFVRDCVKATFILARNAV